MILSFDFVERLGGGLAKGLIAGSILAVIAIIIGFVCRIGREADGAQS